MHVTSLATYNFFVQGSSYNSTVVADDINPLFWKERSGKNWKEGENPESSRDGTRARIDRQGPGR